MKKLAFLLAIISLSGCETFNEVTHWDSLEPAEKVVVGVGGAVILGALIIRNGQGPVQSQNQCISTRSLETGCHR